MSEFDGRVALITGGASGIGLATAAAFASRRARVVIADLDGESGERAAASLRRSGAQAAFVPCDVGRADAVQLLVDYCLERYGRIDCAFNNAGFEGPLAPTADYSEQDWDRIVAVNLKGVWLCMRAEIRQMLKQRRGAIVNTASVAALVAECGYPAYAAAKGGVLQLTRTAAVEYAGSGIRINAVCPGVIRTPMIGRAMAAMRPSRMWPGTIRSPLQRRLVDGLFSLRPIQAMTLRLIQPMGRIGEPAEVAEAVVWLCSDAAGFVTGQHWTIDGGMVVR